MKCYSRKALYYLQTEDDDQEYAVRRQEDSGLLDAPAVAEEGDDEDEGPESNKQVASLVNHGWFYELLEQSGRVLLLCGTERAVGGGNVEVEVYEGVFADSHPGAHHKNSSRNHLKTGRFL